MCVCVCVYIYVCVRAHVCLHIKMKDYQKFVYNLPNMTLSRNLLYILAGDMCHRVKQGTLTLPKHLVPHPLQAALYCIGCSLAGF